MNASAFFAMACKGRRHFAGRTRDTRIIEDDDLTLLGKPVQNRRIPVVEISGEVLVKHKGQTASFAPAPISEANAVGLNNRVGTVSQLYKVSMS